MLPKLIKKNLSRTFPATLKEIRLWKRRTKGLLQLNNGFFLLLCKSLTFDHFKELYPFPPLTLDVISMLPPAVGLSTSGLNNF